MSNQWVKASKTVPHVFGGNCNGTLRHWLDKIGIKDFVHASLNVHSIDPEQIELSALYFTRTYVGYDCLITVGKVADKVLTLAGLDHAALPPTTEKDTADKISQLGQIRELRKFVDGDKPKEPKHWFMQLIEWFLQCIGYTIEEKDLFLENMQKEL